MNFSQRVLSTCKKIPIGKVTTYSEIAKFLGDERAARAVGNALNKNETLIKIPCHRVVRSNGKIGNYRLGAKRKTKLLEKEGVEINEGKTDLEKFLFRLTK